MYVYILLEHNIEGVSDSRIHGVYTTRAAAEEHRKKFTDREFKRTDRNEHGYLALLKKKVRGNVFLAARSDSLNYIVNRMDKFV